MVRALVILVGLVAACGNGEADACWDLPDPQTSTADLASWAFSIISLMVVPDGSGPAFADAMSLEGSRDATVTLHVRDGFGVPRPWFPAEHIWLQALEEGLVSCLYGEHLSPDGGTDAEGVARWVHAPRAGGHTTSDAVIYICAQALTSNGGLQLRFNSPDINGDLHVNLTDAGFFTADLVAGYAYRSDLVFDGVLNLSDAGAMATHLGADCP